MDIDKARSIVSGGDIPSGNGDLVGYVRDVIGYRTLRGTPIDECPQRQLFAVAKGSYERAHSLVQEANAVERRETVEREWQTQLYGYLNITSEEGNFLEIDELEEPLTP